MAAEEIQYVGGETQPGFVLPAGRAASPLDVRIFFHVAGVRLSIMEADL